MASSPLHSSSTSSQHANTRLCKQEIEVQRCILTYEGSCFTEGVDVFPLECTLSGISWQTVKVEVDMFPQQILSMKGSAWMEETLSWVREQIHRINLASFRIYVRESKRKSEDSALVYLLTEKGLSYQGEMCIPTSAPAVTAPHELPPVPDVDNAFGAPSGASYKTEPCMVPAYGVIAHFSQWVEDSQFHYETMAVVGVERIEIPEKLTLGNSQRLAENAKHAASFCAKKSTLVLQVSSLPPPSCSQLVPCFPSVLSAAREKEKLCGRERERT